MKKSIRLSSIDCANCAAKIERAIAAIDGVESVKVNFMMQKLTLEAADDRFDEVLKSAEKAARKIEPDLVFAG